jgi:hypothetical protein
VPVDAESHRSVLDMLPEYVTQQVLGVALHPAWGPLVDHLAHCGVCRAEHAALLTQMQETYSGALPPVRFTPSLPAALAGHIRPSARPAAAPRHAPPQPAYQLQLSAPLLAQMRVRLATRAGEMRLRYAYTFPALQERDPIVTLEVMSADEHATLGVARVSVELTDRPPLEQAGSQVTLTAGGTSLSGVTDSSGIVIFPDVRLDDIAGWSISVVPQAEGPE